MAKDEGIYDWAKDEGIYESHDELAVERQERYERLYTNPRLYEYYDEKTDKVIEVTIDELVKRENEEREAKEKKKKEEESYKLDTNVAKFAGIAKS